MCLISEIKDLLGKARVKYPEYDRLSFEINDGSVYLIGYENISYESDSRYILCNLQKLIELEEVEEETFPFTAYTLQKQLGWGKFCDLTGVSHYAKCGGYEINDSEIFYIKESDIEKYNLQ